jgi:putative inorganic carbon (HCO3(-)) transporter
MRLAKAITGLEPLIVFALSPALLFPSPGRLWALAAIPALLLSARMATGRCLPSTPLNVSLGLLVATVAVSLWATADIGYSLGKVCGVVLGLLIFWSMTRQIGSYEGVRNAVRLFLIAGAAFAVIGLFGTDWPGGKFPLLGSVADRLPRVIRGIAGAEGGFNKNPVAGCLLLFVPLQVALLRAGASDWLFAPSPDTSRKRWTSLLQPALLALTGCTLLLTQSRGAWVGLVLASLGLWLCQGGRGQVAALAIAGSGMASALILGAGRVPEILVTYGGSDLIGSAWIRIELWSRAVAAILDAPLTGLGMNGFRPLLPVLYPTVLTANPDVAHAHNHLLQAALDLGLPGLVAYLSLWILTARLLVSVYRQTNDRILRAIAAGLGTGLLAHFLFSMTDTIALGSKVGVLFWMTLAVVTGLHRVASEMGTSPKGQSAQLAG